MNLDNTEHKGPLTPHKRAAAYGRSEIVEARKMVAQTQARLAQWHRQVARLRATIHRGSDNAQVAREEAASVLPIVIAERIEIERLAAAANLGIAQSSIIRDVMRALSLVRIEFENMANGHEANRRAL